MKAHVIWAWCSFVALILAVLVTIAGKTPEWATAIPIASGIITAFVIDAKTRRYLRTSAEGGGTRRVFNPWVSLGKRILDLAVALPVVVLILPLLAFAVWLIQRFQSPGPLFHPQRRCDIYNRGFIVLKFRTMHCVSGETTCTDPRVFPAGRWLRRTSLDELPQFIHVLSGEMSVVGPRPHVAELNAIFADIAEFRHNRNFVKPGITGLARIQGMRGEIIDLTQEIRADIDYVQKRSLSLDCRIIVETFRVWWRFTW